MYNLREVPIIPKNGLPRSLNPQLYFFRLDTNRVCAYSPVSNMAALLTNEEYDFVTKNRLIDSENPEMKKLLNSFIYELPSFNNTYSKEAKLSFKPKIGKNKIRQMSIIITSICNLRCKYCFVFGGEGAIIEKEKGVSGLRQELDSDAAIYAINEFKPARITIFGWGEPTMAFSVIKKIISSIDTKRTSVEIVTNGLSFSKRDKIVKYLIENKIKIELSFDGLPEFQDANRPLANGSGSFEEVLKTINEIKKYGKLSDFATGRATICGGMEDHIQESIDYMHQLGFDVIGMQAVEMSGRALKNVKPPDLKLFARNIAKAIAKGKKQGINVNSTLLPAGDSWSTACYGCGFMAGYTIALGPDGNFYSCDDPLPIFKVGSIKKDDGNFKIDLNYNKISNFANTRYMLNLKNCEVCPVKCGGGCAKESFDHYKSMGMGGESQEYCDAKRETLAEYVMHALE